MPISKGNIIFQCDGGPGGREESVDESYSEEDDEEETSSTSVEDEEESEEEDDTDEEEDVEEGEGEGEERNIKRPTRNSGPPQSPQQSASLRGNNSDALQRGRVTRQKAREAMPTKRLLRSRNKSPLPPRPGSRVNQVFKCPNCRKEFNNKASLSRHMGWCKQKPAKEKSPRKKKGDEIKKETPKQAEGGHVIEVHSSSSSAPTTPRGRGRPKKSPVPSIPTQSSLSLTNKAEEDFMQQRSPESSPGMLDTSSEEDYEQKEFAANAHQLINHRNSSCSSGPIDVVNPDPDPSVQTEGPVTCPQCKMTYRTLAGFQNHIPTCAPISSDEDSEEEEDDEVDVVHSETSHFQHQNGVNWGVHQTLSETIIAPSPQSPPPQPPMQVHQPMSEENSEESNNSSDSLLDEDLVIDEAPSQPPQQQTVNIPHVIAPPQPLRYVPISPKVPVETSPSKVVGGIRLPLDNTPQVINASGLTLERVESPQIALNSPLRNGLEALPKNSPVRQLIATPTPPPFEHQHQTPPPLPTFHAVQPSHPSSQSSYSSPIYTQSSAFQGQPHHHHHSIPLPTTTATTATAVTFSLLQQAQASGNPPTYTQAQLMPGTIVHNSMMQVPQQMSTSSGDTYHQPAPPQTQHILQQQNYATPQSFMGYAANQGIPQQVFRYQNGIPSSGIHSMAGQTHPQIAAFQQQQMAFAQAQMLRHPVSLDQQQRMQVTPQQLTQYLNPSTGTIEQIPGQLQAPTSGQNNVGTYGLSTNPNQVNFAHLQQSNGQMQQIGTVNPSQAMSFQAQQSNMILQQQMAASQQQIQASHPQPVNSQLPPQTHPNIPQHQMQQLQYPFFQNQNSLPKVIDMQGGGQQQIQQVPQYSIMPQQSQNVGNGTSGLPIGVPMHVPPQQNPQLQQQHLTHPAQQQQQLTNVSNIFSQFANPNQPQQIPPQGTSLGSAPQPPNENNGSVQVQQPQLSQSMLQPNAMNMGQTQVELNLQQQSQLQQQQQQFMALQQQQILAAQAQQQQEQSPNRNAPQQMQIAPQNLQALMMNPSALQWGKPQTLTQAPQQVASSGSSPATQQTIQSQPQQTSGSTQQQQQLLPQQVIQQIAQVTDNAGNTYIIITQPQQQGGAQNGMSTGNNASQVVNLVPGLQSLQCQQQQQQTQRPSSTASQCSANGTPSHSPGSSSVGSMGKSAPCPCATCLEKLANPHMDKYKKVLPYPSSNDHLKPIAPLLAPKQPISIRPAISKQPPQPKVIRVQTANSPRPSTVALLQPNAIQQGSQLRMVTVQQQQQLGLLTPTTPNIAVVRPMENPLQRLSDQISQIESTFLSTPPPQQHVSQPITSADNQSSPPLGPHFTLVTTSPPISSESPPQFVHAATTESTPINVDVSHNQNIDSILSMPTPRLGLVDHGITHVRHPSTPTPSTTPQQLTPNGNLQSPSSGVENGSISSETSSTSGVKRKILEVSPSSSGGGPPAKSIKLLLNRKGGGDTYTVNKIAGASPKGTMRNLKIKGKIKSGEQEGTETEVVVVPSIHFVPIPDPDANEMEGNRTIAEDGQQNLSNNNGSTNRQNLRLTHRAVIVYEVQLQGSSSEPFRSSDVRAVWSYIFETVQGMGLHHNLPPLPYPATNISLPQNGSGKEADVAFNKLGLTHRAIQFLLKELPGLKAVSQPQQRESTTTTTTRVPSPSPVPTTPTATLPLVSPSSSSSPPSIPPMPSEGNENEEDEEPPEVNESGCARFERFMGRKQFDMFGWLLSKHRSAPVVCNTPMETTKALSAPIAMRYRKLKEYEKEQLVVWRSRIHGRGLYTKRDVGKGEMIIEYAGEVIRPLVCDIREKYYESKAIGCYMFRINDHVIDATMKGNAARFINHSCEPNCEAKAIKISGKHHIIIFALRQIDRGEELTYDYKFEKEEEKIPCLCGSKHCRKYLN